MDIIFIDELRLSTLIGIYPREQTIPQTEVLAADRHPTASAGELGDDIVDTINYAEVVERLRHDLETRHFQLLEKLAEHVAGVVLEDSAPPPGARLGRQDRACCAASNVSA